MTWEDFPELGLDHLSGGKPDWNGKFEYYTDRTKCGVVVVCNTVEAFSAWAKNPESRLDIFDTGRLFAHINGCLMSVGIGYNAIAPTFSHHDWPPIKERDMSPRAR